MTNRPLEAKCPTCSDFSSHYLGVGIWWCDCRMVMFFSFESPEVRFKDTQENARTISPIAWSKP